MGISRTELNILDQALEDHTALWELVWSLKNIFPGRSELELAGIAKQAALSLFEKGWITVYKVKSWASGQLEPTPLSSQDFKQIVADDKFWRVGNPADVDSPYFVAAATDEGQRVYMSLKPEDFSAPP